jgi:rare lipoprotein A
MCACLKIVILIVSALPIYAAPAAAETFEDRWSIIPKAKAEAAPQSSEQREPEPSAQVPRSVTEAKRLGVSRGAGRGSRTNAFSGKASYYSYASGKTASGSAFNRNALTAAHRNLPFGTRVRVTDPATSQSVVVTINDRGPRLRGRVLDLSLGAARVLGITERGVVYVRAEVL